MDVDSVASWLYQLAKDLKGSEKSHILRAVRILDQLADRTDVEFPKEEKSLYTNVQLAMQAVIEGLKFCESRCLDDKEDVAAVLTTIEDRLNSKFS